MEGVVPEDPLGMGNLKKMRNKRLHPVSAGNPAGWGRHAVQVLNGRYLHRHLPVQKFCPSYFFTVRDNGLDLVHKCAKVFFNVRTNSYMADSLFYDMYRRT